jgi:cyclic beta-1,2-glucan synthetase
MLSEQSPSVSASQELAGSKIIEPSYLEALARDSAHDQPPVSLRPSRKPTLIDQLDGLEDQMEQIHERFSKTAVTELASSSTSEWILDNISIIRQAFRLIREDMPTGFYEKLPKLDEGPIQGYPRIYRMANILIGVPEIQLDSENVQNFIAAYQEEEQLTTGELWAFPVMLRFVTLEALIKTLGRQKGLNSIHTHVSDKNDVEFRPSDDDRIVANFILHLRSISSLNWKEIVESLSLVERILRTDPMGVYEDMDFETRDRYRGVVEKISLLAGRTEEEVALEAIALAERSQRAGIEENERAMDSYLPKDEKSIYPGSQIYPSKISLSQQARTAHVGFYLLENGRLQLEQRLGVRRTPWKRFTRWLKSNPNVHYFGGIAALTVFFLVIIWSALLASEAHILVKIFITLLSLIPGITVSVNIVNWFITLTTPVQQLPKLDFTGGIPDTCRAMVVIPSMLSSPSDVDSLIEQMELHFLSNPDRNLYFALLTDFPDASQKEMPNDQALMERAEAGIQNLTARYPSWGQGRF